MRLLVLLLLAFSPIFSLSASVTQKDVWNCQISATLLGNAQHFLYYGRDAWNGDGSVYCVAGAKDVFRTVAVSFNSLFDGFGADRNSNLHLLINMVTEGDPNELQVRALVTDRMAGPKVQWRFLSGLNSADVFVTLATPSPAVRSLQRGTLFIRSSGD
jgi:hypothetical protein